MIISIWGFIAVMEIQIKQIKTMMEEHVKYDCIEDNHINPKNPIDK